MAGAGGVGLIGESVTINNTGMIAGGLSGTGAQALALRLTGVSTITNIGTLNGGIDTSGGTVIFSPTTEQTLATFLSGTGNVEKRGSGNLILSGVNTYTGLTTVTQGFLTVAPTGTLGSAASGTVVSNGAALVLQGPSSSSEAITLNGSGPSGFGALRTTGPVNLLGPITLASDSTIGSFSGLLDLGSVTGTNVSLTTVGGGNIAISGPLSLGTGGLALNGSGIVSLRGINSFSGNVTLNGGLLQISGGSAIGDTSVVTVGDGTILEVISTERIGALEGAGEVSINGTSTLFAGDASDRTYSGFMFAFDDGASFVKEGTGTLTLTGTIVGAIGTTISGGTLQVDGRGNLVSTAITNNAALVFNRSDNHSVNGAISGTGSLTQQGSGTLTLTGANTYAGGTTITGGTLQIGNRGSTGALGSGGVLNNAALVFDRSDNIIVSNVISGTGSLTQQGPGTLTLTGANTYAGGTIIGAGTLQFNAISALGTGAITLAGGSLGRTLSGDVSFELPNALNIRGDAGNRILTPIARGLELSGPIDLDGTLRLAAGSGGSIIVQAADVTLTSTSQFIVESGSASIGTLAPAGMLTLLRDAALVQVDGTLNLTSRNATIGLVAGSGTILNNDFTTTVGGGNFAGRFTGSQSLVSLGNLTLSGANSHTGATRIEAGTLALGAADALSQSSPVAIAGGSLSLGTFGSTVTSANLSAGSIAGTAGTLTVAGDYTQSGGTLGAGTTVWVNGNVLLAGGTIAGQLNGRSVAATAAIVEGGSVSVTGGLLTAGPLRIGNTGPGTLLVSGGGTVTSPLATIAQEIGSSGTVIVSGTGSTWSTDGLTVGRRGEAGLAITAGGKVTGTLSTIGGFVTGQGTVTISGAGSAFENSSELFVANSGRGTLIVSAGGVAKNTNGSVAGFGGGSGSVSVTGAGSQWINDGFLQVGRLGTGTLAIAQGGSVTSATGIIGTGPLANGSVTVLGARSDWTMTGALVVGSRGIGNLTLADGGLVDASGVTIASDAAGTGTINIGAAQGSAAVGAGALETASIAFGAGAVSIVFNHTAANFELAAALSGNGTLRQIAGTTILSGTSDGFTGTAQVTGGTLRVNGALGGTVNVTGGVLGGTGSLMGGVTIGAGGTLAAGQSFGTLTMSSLALDPGSVSEFELGAAGTADNDFVNVTGNLALNGGAISIVQTADFGSGQYALFAFGSLTGDLGNMALNPLGGGFVGNLALDIGAVNGPGTVLLNVADSGELVHWNGSTLNPAGAVVGGSGTWGLLDNNFSNATGTVSGPWAGNGALAIFGGASGGTVTIAAETVLSPSGINFATDGYVIEAGNAASGLALAGPTGIAAANGVGATIAAVISGSGSLTKTGEGMLTLAGDNTYTGVTTIMAGTLTATSSAALGTSDEGTIVADGATLALTDNVVLDEAITINGSGVGGNGALQAVSGIGTLRADLTLGSAARIAAAGPAELILAGGLDNGGHQLTVGGAGSVAVLGTIAGGGGLAKVGAGDLILSGTNTFVGDTSLFDGRLQVAGSLASDVAVLGGSLVNSGRIDGSVRNFAALTSTGTLAGGLDNASGAAALISGVLGGAVSNNALITLTGATTGDAALSQTAGGVLDLAGQTLALGSLTGAGQVQLGGGMLSVGRDNTDTLFTGVIAGSGDLIKAGSGTLTLSGANSFAGLTTVNSGTLRLDGDGALAGGVINNAVFFNEGSGVGGLFVNNGALNSDASLSGGLVNNAGASANLFGTVGGDMTNAGLIMVNPATSGIGAVTQTGAGVFDMTRTSTTVGSLAGGGSVLLGEGTLTTGGNDASTSFAGVIAGSGGLTKNGSGTFTLTGANTYSGTTTITGGVLQVGDGGTSGSLGSGVIVNNAVLAINRSDTVILANAITGRGMLVQDGPGTTRLAGINTYTGGTLINRGRLVSDTAALQGAIQNNGVLEFAMATAGTFTGVLGGTGRTEKTGAGVLTFAGDGRTLTGPFAVLEGGLHLDGANGGRLDRSVVTLASGTTLSGNGILGGLVAQSGALVTPGNSVGVIGVSGDIVFGVGSRFLAEVSSQGADQITASGTARLAGALDVVNIGAANAYRFNTAFAVVEAAGGVLGSFDSVAFSGFSPIYRPVLRNAGNGLELVLAPNSLAALAGAGLGGAALTANQAAVAARIDAAVAAGFDPQAFFGVYNLAPAQLAGALGQLSGEVHPAIGRAAIRQIRLPREAVLERASGAAITDNPEGNSFGGWGKLIRSWGDVDAGAGTAAQQTDTEGFIAGFDGSTADDSRSLRFGLYGSYLDTRIRIGALGSNGRIEQTGGGIYASLALGGLSLVAGGGAAHFDITTQRTVDVAGLTDAAASGSTGDMAQVFGRIGYQFDLGAITIAPFVAGDAAWIAIDPVREGGNAAAVSVAGQNYEVASTSTGIAATAGFGKVRIETEAAARFELGDRAPQALVALGAAPGQATRIAATGLARTALTGRLGAVVPLTRRIEIRLDYAGEFSATDTEHSAQAGITIAF
ncbi:hypothetical protein C0V72_05220 [Porphyrobacter sp. TH134]|nr:hypothetical protein C0V72_05220 [Porphyrobacter sp. TH134]